MQDKWFTSDTHFYHKRILDFCRETRLGNDHEEMTELLVQAWNGRVKPNDDVYHLGDFSFGTREKTLAIMRRLNGRVHLVEGNHDRQLESGELKAWFESFQIYKTLTVGNQRFVMMHYPIESWDRMQHGTIHLHGHLHGDNHHECRIVKNRFDVGVDTRRECDMAPYHLDELMVRIKEQNDTHCFDA